MSFTAFWLILCSVLLHASWHFISKSRKPAPAFFMVLSSAGLMLTLPFLIWGGVAFGKLPPMFFLIMAGGGLSGFLCDLGLSIAYRRADVSLAYPLARALPVLLTALVTGIFGLGRAQTTLTLAGMAVIFFGCLLMPLRHINEFSLRNYWNKAFFGIALAAVGTTGYTIFDSTALSIMRECGGVGRITGALAYSAMRESVLFASLSVFVLSQTRERQALNWALLKTPYPYLAGGCAAAAYFLVLLAMGFVNNVSYVQAFRQMSLPVGVLLGVFFLKEKCPPVKIGGMILILAGLVIVALT